MLDQVNHLHKELAELVDRHTDREGPQSTGISSLHFSLLFCPSSFHRNRRTFVVAAPIIGALKTSHIDDAVAALSIKLSNEEAEQLEASYTPRINVNVKNSDRRL